MYDPVLPKTKRRPRGVERAAVNPAAPGRHLPTPQNGGVGKGGGGGIVFVCGTGAVSVQGGSLAGKLPILMMPEVGARRFEERLASSNVPRLGPAR